MGDLLNFVNSDTNWIGVALPGRYLFPLTLNFDLGKCLPWPGKSLAIVDQNVIATTCSLLSKRNLRLWQYNGQRWGC